MEVPGIRELRRKRVQPLWPWLPGKGLKRLEVEKTLSKVTTENKSNNQGIQLGNKGPGTEVVVFYPGAPRFREETRRIAGTDRF